MGLGSRSENCCCCIGVKAGTLILLYIELLVSIITIVEILNGSQADSTPFDKSQSISSTLKDSATPLTCALVIIIIIIFAGLFAIGKRKPSLLIPYFIMRIIEAFAVILILTPFLFLEKKGLDMLNTPKSYNNVYSDITGDDNNKLGKSLDYTSNALYGLIIIEILVILLEIHYAKVVYACYKNMEEELAATRDLMRASLIPAFSLPYIPLEPPATGQFPFREPSNIYSNI